MGLNISLLRESFKEVAEQGDAFVNVFYQKLFTQFPETRDLFPKDMASQREKLFLSLTTILGALERPHILGPYLEQLGEQHNKRFRVAASYYPVVGKILLETLAQFLGPKWTPELEQAWTEAYEAISATMLQAYSSDATK